MNNEEKILALLEKQSVQLDKLTADMADVKVTLAEHGARLDSIEKTLTEHGKMLAEHDARLDSVQSLIEHTIIPRLNTLNDRQLLMQETLARKEDIEELRDAMAEWEVANKATYAEVWKRLNKLES